MPEEVFVLAILFIAFPWVLFRGVVALRKARAGERGGGLKASDLREIVEEAVATAIEPLHDRIDTLEGLLMGETPEPRGRIDATLLDLDDEFDSESESRRQRQPVQS